MQPVRFDTASRLTGLSRRTFWRRMADKAEGRGDPDGLPRGTVDLEALRADLPFAASDADLQRIRHADAGDAEALHDVALMLMEADRFDTALHWLELAAAQNHPDAMHWLGRCHLSGTGVTPNVAIGLSWLARSAAHGHVISTKQLRSLNPELLQRYLGHQAQSA